MNLWQKIITKSGLPECRSIADHLCKALSITGTQTIYTTKQVSGLVQPLVSLEGSVNHLSVIKGEVKPLSCIVGKVGEIIELKGEASNINEVKGEVKCPNKNNI